MSSGKSNCLARDTIDWINDFSSVCATFRVDLCSMEAEFGQRTYITGYYGRLRLLTQGQLTDPSLNSLFIQTTSICETMEAIH